MTPLQVGEFCLLVLQVVLQLVDLSLRALLLLRPFLKKGLYIQGFVQVGLFTTKAGSMYLLFAFVHIREELNLLSGEIQYIFIQ